MFTNFKGEFNILDFTFHFKFYCARVQYSGFTDLVAFLICIDGKQGA